MLMISLSRSDQDAWLSAFEHCSGKSQSPINIDTNKVFYESKLPPIKLEGYDLTGSPALTLINNGHTCETLSHQTLDLTHNHTRTSNYSRSTVSISVTCDSVYLWNKNTRTIPVLCILTIKGETIVSWHRSNFLLNISCVTNIKIMKQHTLIL